MHCHCFLCETVLGTFANLSASLQIRKLQLKGFDLQTDFLPQTLADCGKKMKSTANPQSNNIAEIILCNLQKNTFLRVNVSTELGGFQ